MSPSERRQELFEVLCRRKHDTMENLAQEFNVSLRTIYNDIEILTLSYPIEAVRGRYGGGVRIADWYHPDRKILSLEQAALLKKLAPTLQGDDLAVMNSIISQFAPH